MKLFKAVIVSLVVCFYANASQIVDESFITKFEYGAMLYKNPRGIGCNKCHGKGDKTVVIASYKDKKGITRSIKAPPISKLSFQNFTQKLNVKRNRSLVMPTYFLTKDEIASIYHYITNLNK